MFEKEVRVTARVPATLKNLMRKYVSRDTHLNESDFIRSAIREKLERDVPGLYRELFTVEKKEAPE